MKSASSSQTVPTRAKISEAWSQFRRLLDQRAPWKKRTFEHLEADFQEYSPLCQSFGLALRGARAFEIGCGQRPYRLFYLLANGVDARALDLDHVFIQPTVKDVLASYRDNGMERTMKSVARYREVLSSRFEIVEERVRHPDLGRELLYSEIRSELLNYSDDELFCKRHL